MCIRDRIWDAQEMKEFVLAMMEGARLEGAEKNAVSYTHLQH